jgi:hypothetical protein
MKIAIALILIFSSLQSAAQGEPRPESAVIKLECHQTSIVTDGSTIDDSFKFNLIVYKENKFIYIKEQVRSPWPHWWGGNLPNFSIDKKIKNQAGMDSEKIWGDEIIDEPFGWKSSLLVNRLNGDFEKIYTKSINGAVSQTMYFGKCRKIDNLF